MNDLSDDVGRADLATPDEDDQTILQTLDAGLTLRNGWQAFERLVLPDDASEAQRTCSRKIFALGAQTAFNAFITINNEVEGGLDPQAIDRIDKLQAELAELLPELHSPRVLGMIR